MDREGQRHWASGVTRTGLFQEQSVGKVYNTQELSEYLKVGKAVIDKLRQDGELEFSKLGRTIVYTQKDIDKLLERNHFSFVA